MLSCSVMSDSLQPHRLSPSRLLCPWDFLYFFLPERAPLAGDKGRERWAEPLSTERALHELREEDDRIRQLLASLPLKLQPFPSGAFVAAVSGYPLGQEAPQEAGRPRWEGSGFQAHPPV